MNVPTRYILCPICKNKPDKFDSKKNLYSHYCQIAQTPLWWRDEYLAYPFLPVIPCTNISNDDTISEIELDMIIEIEEIIDWAASSSPPQ